MNKSTKIQVMQRLIEMGVVDVDEVKEMYKNILEIEVVDVENKNYVVSFTGFTSNKLDIKVGGIVVRNHSHPYFDSSNGILYVPDEYTTDNNITVPMENYGELCGCIRELNKHLNSGMYHIKNGQIASGYDNDVVCFNKIASVRRVMEFIKRTTNFMKTLDKTEDI